jgi:hypothetical protein
MANRIFDQRTMERVVDPLVADLQMECTEAIRHGRVWRSRRVFIVWHLIFLKTMVLCAGEEVMRSLRNWAVDDQSAMSRTLGFSVAAITAATAVFVIPPLFNERFALLGPRLLVYSTPQALPLAVPVGFTLGILLGLRGRIVSRRLRCAVLTVAIVCSIASFTALAWILPAVNVAFQRDIFGGIPTMGVNELTLGELRQEIESYRRSGLWDTYLLVSYHMRWALSCATLVLAIFALSVTRRIVAGWTVALAAFGACFSYYCLMWVGRAAALQQTLPAFAGAWLPNLAFVVVSIALLRVGSPKSSLEPEA